ncbi:50S ribosomal protein L11 methyltransferase [Dactylosporangium aurantiacum]|uniref:50S ribosomal protein L11 methyltransferase n=1 Tax=Dactylosporangium aurantiacum TaxID=35754 RepID=A0A9Q9ISW3_9ACTN|nr:50S ribosomal protein L11 methyltransferase [Dactylosporangium aurantiacum]MDG6107972.1 50S ribosomal protein L11 methyltransferase [Dactylosporangium aurantiacum]UWZ59212.1 50S ribosomal protein L11 methyltransferase [Dactylosporangium aurantiacum]
MKSRTHSAAGPLTGADGRLPDGSAGDDPLARADALLHDGRYEEAAEHYRSARERDPQDWRAVTGYNRAIRRIVPRWHFEMMHDHERALQYEAAIKQVVTADHLVLDVGTGSGMLALMAARVGAERVVACEGQRVVAETAMRIVDGAGYAGQVDVVPKMSTDLVVPGDLPRRADVLITETVDCGLLGEGILVSLSHAREHLLTDQAIIVPGRARVLAQLVESRALHQKNTVGELYGFDLSGFNELASLEYFDTRLRRHEHRVLSAPFEVFRFDFHRDGPEPRHATLPVVPTTAGTGHAVVFWFELELVPGIVVTNAPDHPTTHWKQAVQCLPQPVAVDPRDPLVVDVRHDGLRICFTGITKEHEA